MQLGIRALVSIGGDGSLSIAQQMFEGGIPMVGVPKTIDNDLDGTLFTFGFDSAVACATDALDRLHTTAESHNRVMVLEVMGRYAGWIALYAGVAGGADVILIPEIPFTYDSICAKIREREAKRKKLHARGCGGGCAGKGRRLRHNRRPGSQPRGPAGRHRRGGRRRTGKTHGQGGTLLCARPSAARRQPDELLIACSVPCLARSPWN